MMKKLLLLGITLFSCEFLVAQLDLDAPRLEKDQVFVDDVIVDGSICVGMDCVNGESFGADTERLKENNLRIHFDDTSNSGSFPANDWRITINDQNNGGASHFSVDDATAGTTPFRIFAGAGNNALFVSGSGGNVGMGTSTPVVELHITDGDSPTVRLEQNGSSGFTPQTWDMAGNETNFFIRDVTNGSKLPFKIRPNAPTNSLYIDTNGNIGLGDASPDAALDIESGDLLVTNGMVDVNYTGALSGLSVHRTDFGTFGSQLGFRSAGGNPQIQFNRDNAFYFSAGITNSQFKLSAGGTIGTGDVFCLDASGNLEITGTATKPGGGSWAAPSDARLKKNVKTYSEGLETLLKFNPVTYQYNGKGGINDTETIHVGLIAQEANEVAPYMVSEVERILPVKNGDEDSEIRENYLAVDPSAIPYMLINAVKEQQSQLDAKDQQIQNLEDKVSKLEEAITSLLNKFDGTVISNNTDNEEDLVLSLEQLPYLMQNVPNPYDQETSIEYFIPENAQNAQMYFYDNQGKLLKKHNLAGKGTGKLNLKVTDLPSGTYVYTLVVDGKMISSKKMSIQ